MLRWKPRTHSPERQKSIHGSERRPHSLAAKAGWSAAASVGNLSGRLVAQIMIARMLGPDGVGRIAYMLWLIEIASLLANLGLPSSLTRYLAELYGQQRSDEAEQFARWVFIRFVLFSLLGSVLLVILFSQSSQHSQGRFALPALVALFLARGLENINRADLSGRQRFDVLARVNASAAVAVVVAVAVGASAYHVTGALYGYLAGSTIPALYSFNILFRGRSWGSPGKSLRRRVWRFSVNTWLALLISAFVWSRLEIYFLQRYWTPREVAMFAIGLTFASMVHQVATLFSGAFMAHFSELIGTGNYELVQRQYASSTRLLAVLIVPMALGGAAIMPALLPLVFGVAFTPAVPIAMVLTASAALAYSLIGSSLIYANERSSFVVLSGLCGGGLSILAGFVIVARFGALGAAASKITVQCAMISVGAWYIIHRLHYRYPLKSLGRTLMAAVFCASSAWVVVHVIPAKLVALSIAVPLGAIVYAAGVRTFHILDAEDIGALRDIVRRLPPQMQRPLDPMFDVVFPTT